MMSDNYFEIGTVGSTPIYTKVKARRKNLGKLFTQDEINKLTVENKQLTKQYLDEAQLAFDLRYNLDTIYKSLIVKDYVAAMELLSEMLEGN